MHFTLNYNNFVCKQKIKAVTAINSKSMWLDKHVEISLD